MVIESAAYVLADSARPCVDSVWHPTSAQLPTVAGCVGPVGADAADVELYSSSRFGPPQYWIDEPEHGMAQSASAACEDDGARVSPQ